ncbi:MAG: hypothetical protein ACKVU2_04665 [Saprospiraceae bacterium]
MKYLTITTILLLLGTALLAQPDPDRKDERIRSFRVAIYTEVLHLTSEEAQVFWPIFNEHMDARDRIQDDLKSRKQMDSMNDSEVEEQIKRHFEMKQREIDLEKDLYQKLRKVLPVRKIAKVAAAEREFRERLLTKMQEVKNKRLERKRGR